MPGLWVQQAYHHNRVLGERHEVQRVQSVHQAVPRHDSDSAKKGRTTMTTRVGTDHGSGWTCNCQSDNNRERRQTYCNGCNTGSPTCEHKIQGRSVSAADIGSKVTYVPLHAEGNASHKDCECGTISSWSRSCIFVNYGGGSQATSPSDLIWG